MQKKFDKLKFEMKSAVDKIIQLSNTVHATIDHLREDLATLNKRKEIHHMDSLNSEKVTLDVGGKLFATTKSTLLKQPGTFFHILLSDESEIKPDAYGIYFIDRSYAFFELILNLTIFSAVIVLCGYIQKCCLYSKVIFKIL